ncbi:MAG: hypothetical protein V3W41_01140 [Planctomycetota bacterium]
MMRFAALFLLLLVMGQHTTWAQSTPKTAAPSVVSNLEMRSERSWSSGEWLRFGVPIPPSAALMSVDGLSLRDGQGHRLPATFFVMSRNQAPADDPDPRRAIAITWLGVITPTPAASAGPKMTLLHEYLPAEPKTAPRPALSFEVDPRGDIRVKTSRFDVKFLSGQQNLIEQLTVRDCFESLAPSGRLHFADEQNKYLSPKPWHLTYESVAAGGALTVLASTEVEGLQFEARFHFAPGADEIVIDCRLLNPGPYGHRDAKSAHRYFRRLAFELPGPKKYAGGFLGGQAFGALDGVDAMVSDPKTQTLLQHHVIDSKKKPRESLPFEFWQGSELIARGQRAPGTAVLRTESEIFAFGVERFWENAPKALSCRPGTILVDLFPEGGFGPVFRGQYGTPEKGPIDKRSTRAYRFEGARAKTMRIHLGRLRGPIDAADRRFAQRLRAPIGVLATPWPKSHRDLLGQALIAFDRNSPPALRFYERFMTQLVDDSAADFQTGLGRIGLPAFRERGGTFGTRLFYGWMNWGDFPWGDGFSSNHYDLPFSTLFQFLRRGDPRFLTAGREMARHRRDIDQDHDRQSKSPRRGGQFYEKGHWHGNFGPPTPSHTWLGGPILHWLLEADEGAKEAALAGRKFLYRTKLDHWDGLWGARIPGWTIENLLHLFEAFGDHQDLEYATRIIRAVEVAEAGRGAIFNRGYKIPTAKPWMHAILFNAIARHALVTGSKEFHPLLRRMANFLRKRGLKTEGNRVLAWRLVTEKTQEHTSTHSLWPLAASFARSYQVFGEPADRDLSRQLFKVAARGPRGLGTVSTRMRNFPNSESKIVSNIALWGGTALSAWRH